MAAVKFKSDYFFGFQQTPYLFKGNDSRSQSGSGIGIDITSMEGIGMLRVLQSVGALFNLTDLIYSDKAVNVRDGSVIRSNDVLSGNRSGNN